MTTAFLDSDVIAASVRDGGASALLFGDAVTSRLRLATNPIVLQELFAMIEARRKPELFDFLLREVTVLPIDFARSSSLLDRAKGLRNRVAHSNDVLILGSAADCDYLVTYDRDFAAIDPGGHLKVVTPEELLKVLDAAP